MTPHRRIAPGWSPVVLAALVVAMGLATPGVVSARECSLKACAEEVAGVCGSRSCGERRRCAKQVVRDCRAGRVVCGWCRTTGSSPTAAHHTGSALQAPWSGCPRPARDSRATFERIQEKIFAKRCVGCHAAGTETGGLVLEGEEAYRQLVWTRAATAPGNFRVAPGDATDSYLVELLEASRARKSARSGGVRHPRVRRMSASLKELLHHWIAAGAPRHGIVPGERGGPDPMDTPPAIPPPPAPAVGRGIQIKLGPFTVPPRQELEVCRYEELPPVPVSVCSESKSPCQADAECAAGEQCVFFMRGAESFSNLAAHHFFLATYDGEDGRTAFPEPQVEGDPFCLNFGPPGKIFAGTDIVRGQTGVERIGYGPPGTAKRLRAGQPVLLDAHFANPLNVPVSVDIWVNIDFAEPAEVGDLYTGGRLQWNSDIDVPPCKRQTSCMTWTPETPIDMFSFFTHNDASVGTSIDFCERVEGTECVQVGARLYESADALDPKIMRLGQPLRILPGQGLQHCCSHLNNPPRLGCTGTQREKDIAGITETCSVDADCAGLPGATGRCEPQPLKFGVRPGDDACLLIGYYVERQP